MSDAGETPSSESSEDDRATALRMTAEIVAAYAGGNSLPGDQLTETIETVYGTLRRLSDGDGTDDGQQQPNKAPAVPVAKSVTPDYLVCLEDGRKMKMLKRHLRAVYGLSPEEYRRRWGLPTDYPMVAPNYSQRRSRFAKQIGLGKR